MKGRFVDSIIFLHKTPCHCQVFTLSPEKKFSHLSATFFLVNKDFILINKININRVSGRHYIVALYSRINFSQLWHMQV